MLIPKKLTKPWEQMPSTIYFDIDLFNKWIIGL
jgi:hypothetical protein